MKLDNGMKLGILIWTFICGYGMYMGMNSDEYFYMLNFHGRLETRSHYLKMCELSNGNTFKGEVIRINEIKGGARTVYIQLNNQSDSVFLLDYIPTNEAQRFSIQSGIMTYWLGWGVKEKTILVGSQVHKTADSDMLHFNYSGGVSNIDFFHWYRDEFETCEDAYNMDVIHEYEEYLRYCKLSNNGTEKLSPSIQEELDSLLLRAKK